MSIDSPLPGLAGPRPKAACGAHDRRLVVSLARARPVPASPPPGRLVLDTVVDGRRLHWGSAVGGDHLLRVPGVADFAVAAGGGRVDVRPEPGVDPDALVLLLRGLVLGFALALAGECVLHASAVAVDGAGGAVAFAGPSGTGKSTLAAVCCADGARFVTDDLLRVGAGSRATWIGHAAELRLRPGAPGVPGEWERRTTPDGRAGVVPPRAAAASGPLRAVVLPVPVRDGPVRVRRLPAAAATTRLVAAHRIVHWVDPVVVRQQLAHAARLVRTTPVFEARVPWSIPVGPGIGTAVLQRVLDAAGAG